MGRKTYLTVRKRRCNERQEIDNKKKKMCERPPVLRMYGIAENTDHLPTTSDDPAGTVPVNDGPPSIKPISNDPPSTDHYPAGAVLVNDDPPNIMQILEDPADTVPFNDNLMSNKLINDDQ